MTTTAQRQRLWGSRLKVAEDDPYSWLLPPNDVETIGASRITFYLYLDSITGAPATAKLTAKFQKGHASPQDVEFANPVWQDFDDHDVQHRCLGGEGWGYQDLGAGPTYNRSLDHSEGVLHDSVVSGSMVLGYFVTHTVTEPLDKVRVKLNPIFTGGAGSSGYYVSPYWVVKY